MATIDAQTLQHELKQFIGSENLYHLPLYKHMNYTDGVRYFARNAGNGAYWFLELCAFQIHHELQKQQPFISITLKATTDSRGSVEATDGNNNLLFSHELTFTDCPAGEYKFFLIDGTLLLTSEY